MTIKSMKHNVRIQNGKQACNRALIKRNYKVFYVQLIHENSKEKQLKGNGGIKVIQQRVKLE